MAWPAALRPGTTTDTRSREASRTEPARGESNSGAPVADSVIAKDGVVEKNGNRRPSWRSVRNGLSRRRAGLRPEPGRPARSGDGYRITRTGYPMLLLALIIALVAAILAGLCAGAAPIAPNQVWQSVLHHLTGLGPGAADLIDDHIVWTQRAPRTLAAALVGASLAVAGALLQTLVRNPLAEPYILGASAGASVGAVAVVTLGAGSAYAARLLPFAAFAGALLALLLALLVGRRHGILAPGRLLLAGVAVGYLLQALTSYLQIRATPDQLAAVMFWLLGSLSGVAWQQLTIVSALAAAGLGWALARARTANRLLLSDDASASLGVDVTRVRVELLVVAALLTGAAVALAGSVGFVGLIVPHTLRLLIGSNHRLLLPAAIPAGAAFLTLVDAAGREMSKTELPLGILTAFLGVPFLLWLVRREPERS